jgi:hypothetical protein
MFLRVPTLPSCAYLSLYGTVALSMFSASQIPQEARMRRTFEIFAVAVLLMLQWVVPAHASPILQLEQAGFAPLQISDNQPGDIDPRIGFVMFSGTYGNFEQVSLSARSEPTAGGGLPELNLTGGFFTGIGGGGVPLTLWAADVNYNLGTTPATAFGTAFGAVEAGSIAIQSWVNPANLIGLSPSPGVVPAGSAIVFGPPGPTFGRNTLFPVTDTVDVLLSGPFSIFHRAILNAGPDVGGAFAVDTRVSPVPEPASLVLLGSGVVALAVRKRRRQRQS